MTDQETLNGSNIVLKKKKKNKKKVWIILGVVVVVAALVAANIFTQRKPKGKQVDVEIVKQDSLVQTVAASGKIQPEVDVNISANVSGRILYLGAQEGESVQRGELLVRIEDEQYVAALDQFRFMLASAEASLEEAQSKLKRTRELHTSGMSSDAELETMMAMVKRAEAEVDRARANVNQAKDDLDKTSIYAPIGGVLSRLNKEVGEMAIGATFTEDVIMVVSQLDRMEVNAEVNENDVVLVEIGDPVQIEVFALPDTFFPGIVTEIAHSGLIRGQGTAEEVTNFEVKVAVRDHVPELRPGMSATVEIATDSRDKAVVIPQEAVVVRSLEREKKKEDMARKGIKAGDGGNKRDSDEEEKLVEVVYVVSNDTAWVRQVKLGIYSDTKFEIVTGLEPGDTVVTGPYRVLSRELTSGQHITFDMPEDEEGDGAANSSESEETLAQDAAE